MGKISHGQYSKRIDRFRFWTVVAGLLLAASGAAETGFDNTPIRVNSGASSDMVSTNAKASMGDVNGIVDNSALNAANGREQKTNDAKGQAAAGSKEALAAGIAMTARAIPMLASIVPSVVAAGATLMGMAALEFAQAAASNKTSKENGAAENQLREDAGTSGSQAAGGAGNGSSTGEIASALASDPALASLLQERGVNPEAFAQQLASGAISDPQSVLNAVNNKTDIPAGDFAKGAALAQSQASDALGGKPEPKGSADPMRVGNNDDIAKGGTEAGKGGGAGGGAGSTVAKAGGTSEKAGAAGAGGGLTGTVKDAIAAATAAGDKKAAAGTAEDAAALTAEDEAALMGMFSQFGLGNGKSENAIPSGEVELSKLGILKTHAKQNIFQLAHRNYRSYQKWRKSTKVATR